MSNDFQVFKKQLLNNRYTVKNEKNNKLITNIYGSTGAGMYSVYNRKLDGRFQ